MYNLEDREDDPRLQKEQRPILGIDFGGSSCTAVYYYNNQIHLVASEDFQKSAKITVLECERLSATDCKTLGTYVLQDLEQNYKGNPVIEVEFTIDYDGLLKLNVTDLKSLSYISGTLRITRKLTAVEKKEIAESAAQYRKSDLERINKIKSAEVPKNFLKLYKQDIDGVYKDRKNIESNYQKAQKTLHETPLDYDTVAELKQKFESFYYEYTLAQKENNKDNSDIRKLL